MAEIAWAVNGAVVAESSNERPASRAAEIRSLKAQDVGF